MLVEHYHSSTEILKRRIQKGGRTLHILLFRLSRILKSHKDVSLMDVFLLTLILHAIELCTHSVLDTPAQ